ncbi:MAG: glycosyltransferase [bacterium]|nr:glycosyltransferase [bacterium]
MDKIIVVFGMFTYDEYELGISNTNSHIYNWLKSENPQTTIIFADFNRFGLINKLKYFVKHVLKKQKNEVVSSSLLFKLIKINDKNLVYKGICYNKLFRYINKSEYKNVEIWCFNPFIKKYDVQKNIIKYFYTIDDWKENKVFKKYSEFLKKRYQTIPNQSKIIFINNQSLKEKLYDHQKNIYFIPNGVDAEYYKNFDQTSEEIKKEINNKIGSETYPIIGYMGVISTDRVNFELCEYLIKSNPNFLFIFAGPVLAGFDSSLLMSKYKNVKFIGTVYYQQLPYLFSKYNVCIIPHKLSEFVQSMDPKKLYEYLAAGKPIVTTPVSGTEKFQDSIYIANSNKEFSHYIQTAIDENDDQKIKYRQLRVAKYDWKYRFDEIKSIISI